MRTDKHDFTSISYKYPVLLIKVQGWKQKCPKCYWIYKYLLQVPGTIDQSPGLKAKVS